MEIRVITRILILLLKILILRMFIFSGAFQFPGILFEFFTILFVVCTIELLHSKITFVITNILLSLFCVCSVMYFSHFGRLLDDSVILQAAVIIDIRESIFDLFSISYFLFFTDFLLFAVFSLLKRTFDLLPKRYLHKARSRALSAAALLGFTISVFCLWLYPEKDSTLAMAQDTGMLNTTFYQLYVSISHNRDDPASAVNPDQIAINKIKQIIPAKLPRYYGMANGKNLIIVQLESTENFVIGLSINGQEITPNINGLLQESLYFPHFFSQVGQGNTSDAEFICNTSIYPLQNGPISRAYIGVTYPSLPRLLKEKGYASLTFHPNTMTFWSRDNLYPCLGFDKVYDKSFYQDEDLLGPWGSSDEMLYQKAIPILRKLQMNKQKFYASFITLTNHHSYRLPEERAKIELPPQLKGTYIGNYLTSVNYEDYAFGLFIDDLRSSGILDQSLLVIYGDHFGISKNQEESSRDLFLRLLGRKHDAVDSLNVPLLIRIPGLKPQIVRTTGGQVDLMPTISNLIGISLKDQIVFGQDILNQENNLLGFRFYYPEGTLISSQILYLPDSKTGIEIINHHIQFAPHSFTDEEDRIRALITMSDQYLNALAKQKK